MNGIGTIGTRTALPATRVLRLSGDKPVSKMQHTEGDEVILEAVRHSPRICDARPIAALMPEVLARYGIAGDAEAVAATNETSIDFIA
jgi:hypothetical protein